MSREDRWVVVDELGPPLDYGEMRRLHAVLQRLLTVSSLPPLEDVYEIVEGVFVFAKDF